MTTKFTQDDVNVRLYVNLGFSLTIGLYDGPVTPSVIVEHIKRMLTDSGVEEFIDTIEIAEISLGDDKPLVRSTNG